MLRVKFLTIAVIAGALLLCAPKSRAQLSVSVNIGPPPVCPYGYFPYAPYNCAPYGYYGPQWFSNRIFIGAGPWFHGPRDFHGYVNRYYDPRYGYHGRLPRRGDRDRWHPDSRFRGTYQYDGRGNRWNGHPNDQHGNPHDRGNDHNRGHDHGHGNDHGHGHHDH